MIIIHVYDTIIRRVAGRRALAWWHDMRVHIPLQKGPSLEDSVE